MFLTAIHWSHWLAETLHWELSPLKYFRLDAVEDKLFARACWIELVTKSKDSKLFADRNAAELDVSWLFSKNLRKEYEHHLVWTCYKLSRYVDLIHYFQRKYLKLLEWVYRFIVYTLEYKCSRIMVLEKVLQ